MLKKHLLRYVSVNKDCVYFLIEIKSQVQLTLDELASGGHKEFHYMNAIPGFNTCSDKIKKIEVIELKKRRLKSRFIRME